MKKSRIMATALAATAAASASHAATTADFPPDEQVVYRRVGDIELRLHAFKPAGFQPSDRRPAVVFFFGGGWAKGAPSQFYPHARHLAERGLVAFSAEYRIASLHQTTPFDAVEDAREVVRWIRAHAAEWGVDPARIAAGGGSAGGHLAAMAAVEEAAAADGAGGAVSARPDALVLFNPYLGGDAGDLAQRFGERWREISPIDRVGKGAPPTLIQVGTEDAILPVETARRYEDLVRQAGGRCDLRLYEGQAHGFFNFRDGGNRYYTETVAEMDRFLESLGYRAAPAR
jgi:acetyl esterase/lipase